jgi:hypothetical protein
MKSMNAYLTATIILTLDTKYLFLRIQYILRLASEPLLVVITTNVLNAQ